jgi:membrane fusion protein (multidrug efflux system)
MPRRRSISMPAIRRIAALVLLAALSACGSGETPDGTNGTAPTTADSAAAGAIVLTAADVTTATRRDVTSGIIITGSLEPATSVTLTAQVAGTISALAVDRGSRVTKGQRLATIDAEGVRSLAAGARAAVAAAESNLAVLRTRRDAARRLLAAGAISQVDADNAESAFQAAEAQVAAAKGQAAAADEMAGFTALTSPIDGVISDRPVEQGEPIDVGDPVLTVVNTSLLELAGRVPVDEAAAVRVGQAVTFTLDAFPDRTFRGTVDRKDPTASAADRQVGVYVRLPNGRGELIAGQFARGEVAGRSVRGVLTVPSTAVQGTGAEAAVFVVTGEKLVRRPVTVGPRDAGSGVVSITAGLNEGDRVLVRPVPGLTDGQRVSLAADR